MLKKDFKRLLRKYLSNDLNETGSGFIESWYDSIDLANANDPLNNEEKSSQIKSAVLSNVMKHVQRKPITRRINPWYYAAASVLLLIVSSYFIIQQFSNKNSSEETIVYAVINAPAGSLKRAVLPDSSEIWLNAGSTLRYNTTDFTKNREIYLDEGEAFFTVVKDPNHPFIVHSQHMITRVLGTSFNVKSYQALNYTSVQVKTGKVLVQSGGHYSDTMSIGQSLTYHKGTNEITRITQENIDPASWITGLTILQESTFEELALVMYNRYRVVLKSTDPAVATYRYTINIHQNRSVDDIIKTICSIHQNKFRKSNNEIVIYK